MSSSTKRIMQHIPRNYSSINLGNGTNTPSIAIHPSAKEASKINAKSLYIMFAGLVLVCMIFSTFKAVFTSPIIDARDVNKSHSCQDASIECNGHGICTSENGQDTCLCIGPYTVCIFVSVSSLSIFF